LIATAYSLGKEPVGQQTLEADVEECGRRVVSNRALKGVGSWFALQRLGHDPDREGPHGGGIDKQIDLPSEQVHGEVGDREDGRVGNVTRKDTRSDRYRAK